MAFDESKMVVLASVSGELGTLGEVEAAVYQYNGGAAKVKFSAFTKKGAQYKLDALPVERFEDAVLLAREAIAKAGV